VPVARTMWPRAVLARALVRPAAVLTDTVPGGREGGEGEGGGGGRAGGAGGGGGGGGGGGKHTRQPLPETVWSEDQTIVPGPKMKLRGPLLILLPEKAVTAPDGWPGIWSTSEYCSVLK
jgi:hypothetical protein